MRLRRRPTTVPAHLCDSLLSPRRMRALSDWFERRRRRDRAINTAGAVLALSGLAALAYLL